MPVLKTLKQSIVRVQNILLYIGPTWTIYKPEKTSEKWQRVKFYLLKYATTETSNINTNQKPKMNRIEMYNLQTRLVQFKDQKKLKTFLINRIEHSINKNALEDLK